MSWNADIGSSPISSSYFPFDVQVPPYEFPVQVYSGSPLGFRPKTRHAALGGTTHIRGLRVSDSWSPLNLRRSNIRLWRVRISLRTVSPGAPCSGVIIDFV